MGNIREIHYKVSEIDPMEIAKSYFYKSTLAFSDRYIDEVDRIESMMIRERNKYLSEIDNVTSKDVNKSILGLSSIEDRVIFIV